VTSPVTTIKITVTEFKIKSCFENYKKTVLNCNFTTFEHSLTVLTLVSVVTWF